MPLLAIIYSSLAFGQNKTAMPGDSGSEKEGIAIAELGGATGLSFTKGGLSFGPDFAVEATPIENWLELEAGASPSFAAHSTEWDFDLLFKKPWTLSRKVEFMFGVGPALIHLNENNEVTNTMAGEIALDFMFWPGAKHKFGWYLEPGYEYSFAKGHEQSIGISGGLLISIP